MRVAGFVREMNRWERERVEERVVASAPWPCDSALLRMSVRAGRYTFSYGEREDALTPIGDWSGMECGGWVSARPGLFCMNLCGVLGGFADFAYCHVRECEL